MATPRGPSYLAKSRGVPGQSLSLSGSKLSHLAYAFRLVSDQTGRVFGVLAVPRSCLGCQVLPDHGFSAQDVAGSGR